MEMKIDAQVAEHYRRQPAAVKGADLFTIEQLRAAADRIYNDSEKKPPVHETQDVFIPCSWGRLPLRIYRPDAKRPLPALLYFHGGGFIMHNIASHDSLCRALCLTSGCIVVSVGYRLAPETALADLIGDGYDALCWVNDHAEELGIDGKNLAVAGDSAGAVICSSLGLLCRDRGGPRFRLQILCYGMGGVLIDETTESYQAFIDRNPVLNRSFMKCVDECVTEASGTIDPEDPVLNPRSAPNLSGLPKTISISAEYDPLRDDGEAFADKLLAAGNDVVKIRVPGVYHGFLLLWEELDVVKRLLIDLGEMIRKTFTTPS